MVNFTILLELPLELNGAARAGLRKMCSAQLVRLLLGLSFFFPPICGVIEKLRQIYYHEVPINTAHSARGKEGVSAVIPASVPLPLPNSGFILLVLASFMLDCETKNILCVQELSIQIYRCKTVALATSSSGDLRRESGMGQ